MANLQDLPIDIHSGKLLDWLVSRRHCQKDWQKNVLTIREKIKHAILDMPESEEILELLQGTYINFFHCQRIIEILRETEKDSKNFLGYYSSQRMKDWQEIESLYKKNNVGLAEAAQILQRLVQYEIPAQKKQIAKAEQVLAESIKKEKDYGKQAEDGRKLYEKELQRIGIKGHALRAELLALASDLPSFFAKITNDIINLKDPYEYYIHFRNYIHQNKQLPGRPLPLLVLLLEKGPSLTAFEFKYGVTPTSIQLPSYELLLKEDEKKYDDEIDFGDEDIDFGDDAEIDFPGDDANIDVVADTKGAVGESVAVGEDALGVVENMETQKVMKNELNELLAFLTMRNEDEKRDASSDVFIRGFEKRPTEISKVSPPQIGEWISQVKAIIDQLSDQQKIHLFRIRTSPQYVEHLVEEIEAKKGLEARYKRMQSLMVEKQNEAREQTAKAGQALQTLVTSTKLLQKQLEEEISKKYDGRRVNIMGGITAAIAAR
ncbi:CDK5 regulatory subunit-associated protein 3 [Trichostrongylus colubriformis]|uniref:CDK5 regulatory subunit-associated protein 3 n=1 Tax=Trichostrongylus colubriformis TaxID=6319 RepID=A0AAN8IT00_TRICO